VGQIKKKIQEYLEQRFGADAALKDREKLGKGVHGTANRLRFSSPW
jgi:hypothetical protein